MEPEGSLPCSQQPATCPCLKQQDRSGPWLSQPTFRISILILSSRLSWLFRNMIKCLWWWIDSTSCNLQAGGPPLAGCPRSAYSIYPQLPFISGGRSSIRNLRTRHAVVRSCRKLVFRIIFNLTWICSLKQICSKHSQSGRQSPLFCLEVFPE
jgi:hypothetical protein